jgi:hypothetical protein
MLLWAARRNFGWAIAILLTVVVSALSAEITDVLAAIVFVVAIGVVLEQLPIDRRYWVWIAPVAGALAAIAVLMKFNVGMLAVIVFPLAIWSAPPGRWRSEARFFGTFLGVMLVLWLLAGGNPLDITTWLRHSYEFAAGYGDGGLLNDPRRAWELTAFAGLIVFGGALLVHTARDWPRARRILVALIVLAFSFSYFKHAFVRHDAPHSSATFLLLSVMPLAFVWTGRERLAALAMIGGALWCVFLSLAITPRDVFTPVSGDARRFADQFATVVSPDRRARLITDARAQMRAGPIPLDATTLSLVRGHTVHVEPHETSVVWLYEFDWRPAPIFQTYAAHTAVLDNANADRLASPSGPERILRHRVDGGRVNGRYPEGDSPAYTLAMVCHYRQIHATDAWQVLARVPNRCGPEREIASLEVKSGEVIPLPAPISPQSLTYVRIDAGRSLSDAARAFLFKPRVVPLIIVDEDPARTASIFFRDTQNPMIVRGPARTAWPPQFSGETAHASRIRFEGLGAHFRLTFFEAPIGP